MAPRKALHVLDEIVVPTDFSPRSTRAMTYALALASRRERVTAVHAIDPLPYRFGPRESSNSIRKQTWALAQERMVRWLLEGKFSAYNSLVIEGEAAPAIVKYAAAKRPGLIVLATSARRHAARFLLGSVAEEIFREVSCPVIVLGPKVRSIKKGPPTCLLFATELEPHSIAALPQLSQMSRKLHAEVSVLRAVPGGRKSARERDRLQVETQNGFEAAADRNIRNRTKNVTVAFAPPVKAIVAAATKLGVDAIVMGVRSGGELPRATTHIPWTIAHRVIAEAKCPVMTIRG